MQFYSICTVRVVGSNTRKRMRETVWNGEKDVGRSAQVRIFMLMCDVEIDVHSELAVSFANLSYASQFITIIISVLC